jgi:arginine deiminase
MTATMTTTEATTTSPQSAFGVHSEVGTLRKVMVCAPGRAHQRLTPSNCDALLFDDVLWVDVAKRDHFDFVQKMRDRGIDVVEMHNLLTQTVAIPEARQWILDNQVVPNQVGLGLIDEIRSYLEGLSDRELAETLIGGLSTEEFPERIGGEQLALIKDAAGVTEYLFPPLPNTLYTRDTTCWIYGGCTLNPLFWPARHEETILAAAIYRFHPDFAGKVNVWWGDPLHDHGLASLEGGDVMPIGKGNVLIGMSERTSRQAISQLAAALFSKGAAERVIVAAMPKLRAAMHLDTVFTFADRDCVLVYPDIVDTIHAYPTGQQTMRVELSCTRTREHSSRWWPRPWGSRRCALSRREAPPICASGRNGIAAPILSVHRPASSLRTTATPMPTPCCARQASRSLPSRAQSSAAGAAAAIA